eukprot:7303405-Heterocapsa_arctica.AAC.1
MAHGQRQGCEQRRTRRAAREREQRGATARPSHAGKDRTRRPRNRLWGRRRDLCHPRTPRPRLPQRERTEGQRAAS